MHIYFSGIGGHGIGPLAIIAQQAGYVVSGSDKQESTETRALQQQGIQLHVGQSADAIAAIHAAHPIDWLVFSSAILRDQPNHPELAFAKIQGIRFSKRDELLNKIIGDRHLKLVAVAGTHGKTTTTAMLVWLYKELGLPVSYSVGAEIGFAAMGHFDPASTHFVYECDEFDRNFLSFHPHLSAITGIAWDHHEIFATQEAYNQAFRDFIGQSGQTIIWQRDLAALDLAPSDTIHTLNTHDPGIDQLKIAGRFNREDAWLALHTAQRMTGATLDELRSGINHFPGLQQRMEQLAPNLYTNYAHTPEKIVGGMSTALELAKQRAQDVVVIYEPLTNRRQHYIKNDYRGSFAGAKKLYWVPTYLAREDPNLPVLTPAELIQNLSDPGLAEPAALNDELLARIHEHLQRGDMVVAMGASGAGSMDEWLRQHFGPKTT